MLIPCWRSVDGWFAEVLRDRGFAAKSRVGRLKRVDVRQCQGFLGSPRPLPAVCSPLLTACSFGVQIHRSGRLVLRSGLPYVNFGGPEVAAEGRAGSRVRQQGIIRHQKPSHRQGRWPGGCLFCMQRGKKDATRT